MKALDLLITLRDDYIHGELDSDVNKAIKELKEYVSDMDSYLDYTTGSRCTKSFNSCLGSIKIAYGKELEKLVKENSEDRLAELEKVILDYYLAKGYQIGADGLGFKVRITTLYQWKLMHVILLYPTKLVFQVITETPKEMFDKAFEHFSIKEQELNKEFKVLQGDRFSPPFVIKTFKTKKEADDFVDAIQKESSNHDEYTAFWVEEFNG